MAKQPPFQAQGPFNIYYDSLIHQLTPMISHAPMPPAPKPPRQPLQSGNANIVLNPPTATIVKQSPSKSNARPSSSHPAPLKPAHGNKLNVVQTMPPSTSQPSTDCLEKKQPVMSRFKTVAQKPPPNFNVQVMDKENVQPPIYPAPAQSQFSLALENYCQKPSGKRLLLEPAPIKELRPAKKSRADEPLPPPDSFPPIVDDGKKPNHSYATLIGMAILRSPQRRLTLAQIYKWISDTYSYYNPNDAGWQNSIRHNLSLNKHFIKQERPKDDPGKGNYWAIEPGAEHLFMKEKPSRKSTTTAENMPVMSTRLEPSQLQAPLTQKPMLPSQFAMPQNPLPALPPAQQHLAPAPPLPEISSDATIPASDPVTIDEGLERPPEDELLNESGLLSPLPAAMHSSPPIPRHIEPRRGATPPPQQPLLAPSATNSRSRRRRFMSMDDSGYISSLESSVKRPPQGGKLPTSEADRPRIRRGRAEEEIARLRASSYDSPSKRRPYGHPLPPSSSPLQQTSHRESGQMLPPLTPATKLKSPPKPPPSLSPGTNLRLHRENIQHLVDSPFRRVCELLPENDNAAVQLTPGFDDVLRYELEVKKWEDTRFPSIFDSPFPCYRFAQLPEGTANKSPAKRSAKKPKQRLERKQSTSALNDATATAHDASNSGSFLQVPNQASNLAFDTPSKVFDGLPSSPSKFFVDLQSPSKAPQGNDENVDPWASLDGLGAPDFFEDDGIGFDMLAGFESIGASYAKSSQRPGLGHSYTTPF
ncbi:hypothetical protein VTK56DRAFT_9547 [Thermocarpiscus australiensis]